METGHVISKYEIFSTIKQVAGMQGRFINEIAKFEVVPAGGTVEMRLLLTGLGKTPILQANY